MQIQKEEIRKKILEAATQEFLHNAYRKASLRVIAKTAGITVSNIYRYYENKATLYIAVVEPAWEGIQRLIAMDKQNQKRSATSLLVLSNEIVKVFIENRPSFEILLLGDSDTPRRDTRDTLLELVISHIDKDLKALECDRCDDVVIKALATAVCEAMICVISQYNGDKELLTTRIYTTILFLLGNGEFIASTEDALC